MKYRKFPHTIMQVAAFTFNPIGENTYLLWDETRECIVIDAGASIPSEEAALDNFIAEHGLKPVLAANTHGHFDHTLGVQHLRRRYGIPFALSGKDRYLLDAAVASGSVFGIPIREMPPIDRDLDGAEELRFGSTVLRVIPTPGHTPGGVSFYHEASKVLFSGDTLFRESIGRTDLDGGDYPTLMRSILDRLLPLGDDTTVRPGHAEQTTLGHESLYNPFIVEVLQHQIDCNR